MEAVKVVLKELLNLVSDLVNDVQVYTYEIEYVKELIEALTDD